MGVLSLWQVHCVSILRLVTGYLYTYSLSFLASLKLYSVHHLEFWQTIIFYYLGEVVLSYHREESHMAQADGSMEMKTQYITQQVLGGGS